MSKDIDSHVERRYQVERLVGSGAYGLVWKARDRKTGSIVALKKLFDAFSNKTDAQRTYRETVILQGLANDNIVRLLNVMRSHSGLDLYLVFDLMETDLHAAIRSSVLQDIHKQFISYQLVRCIKYLHARQLIHRDLKPANLLLNSDCLMRLADFGLARSLVSLPAEQQDRPVLTDYIATRWYRAPEVVLSSTNYTTAIDMWAVGCIVGEMLVGKPLFPGTSTTNQLQRLIAALGKPGAADVASLKSSFADSVLSSLEELPARPLKEHLPGSPDAVDLVLRLLRFNPLNRLSAAEAMRHPYIAPFASAADLQEESQPPFLVPIPDTRKASVEDYRNALYTEIGRKKLEKRKKRNAVPN